MVRVSGVTVDITERKRAEERQNLLTREVDHRAKNALALAQSIVRLTRAQDIDAYVRAVEGRISALARIHTILSLSSWQGAEITRLVDEELAPYSVSGQIKVSGPELQLLPATAQTLALAFHELVTNSAKYGALSAVPGRLSVHWEIQHDDALTLIWEEIGGPLVHKPASRGFGTQKRDRQHRKPARRTGAVRLARRRAGLPVAGPAAATGNGARSQRPEGAAASEPGLAEVGPLGGQLGRAN